MERLSNILTANHLLCILVCLNTCMIESSLMLIALDRLSVNLGIINV